MTDINTYRCRIGLFSPKLRKNKFLRKSDYYKSFCENDDKSGETALSVLTAVFKLVLILALSHQPASTLTDNPRIVFAASRVADPARYSTPAIAQSGTQRGTGYYWSPGWSEGSGSGVRGSSKWRFHLK